MYPYGGALRGDRVRGDRVRDSLLTYKYKVILLFHFTACNYCCVVLSNS